MIGTERKRCGIRASFNAGCMQQLTFRDFQTQHPHLKSPADEWDETLQETFAKDTTSSCTRLLSGAAQNTRMINDYALKKDFPVQPYHPELFAAKCINAAGDKVIVETYAHDMRKMNHNLKGFFSRRTLSGLIRIYCCDPRVVAALQPWAGVSQRLRR